MASQRTTALVGFVVAIAVVQIVVEDVIVYRGATDTAGPTILDTPVLLIGLPFVLFLLLTGAMFAWALTGETPRQ